MHRHDLDLIADFASGNLDNEAKARALISSCETCAAEYQVQSETVAQLRGLEPAQMTDSEKAVLHRELWTELRSGARDVVDHRYPAWIRWSFGTAAIIALVVGSFAVLSNLGSFDQVSETFSEIGSGLDNSGAGEEPSQGGADPAAAPFAAGDDGEAAVDTTAAAESATVPDEVDQTSGEEGLQASYLAAIDVVRKSRSAVPEAVFASPEVEEETMHCLDEAGLGDYEAVGSVDRDSDFLLAMPANIDHTPDVPIAVVDPNTCEVLHTDD